MAMMIGALMIHGIAPGPRVMTDRPGLFWGLIASMWIGNLMLVVLNLPLVGIWVRLLRVPYRLLYPAIIVFCCIGAYTINSKPFDVYVMAFFAIFGYVCAQARLRAGAAHPRLRAGADDGGESAPRAADLARRSDGVRAASRSAWHFCWWRRWLLIVVAAPAIRKKREEALQE